MILQVAASAPLRGRPGWPQIGAMKESVRRLEAPARP